MRIASKFCVKEYIRKTMVSVDASSNEPTYGRSSNPVPSIIPS